MNPVKLFSEINKGDVKLVGGKGLSLGLLTQAELPVPPGFVITTEAYRSAPGKINANFTENILDAFDALGAKRVAVRSSAVAEDSADASWAGQFESYLNVTRASLIESVKKCWDSASSEVVREYAGSQSITEDNLDIAVIVQKMVDSEISGVAFSANPVNKDENEVMIEAVYGLGELLVQGMVTPDNYLISKSEFEILDKKVPEKAHMIVYVDGENKEQPVHKEMAHKQCLDDKQIIKLSQLVVQIEQLYGVPQDIEWALEASKFYIVQSRPITTL